MNWTAIVVFILLVGGVTVIGFLAAHWRHGDLDLLNEWGPAGRRLGTIVIWFLLGGTFTRPTLSSPYRPLFSVPAPSGSSRCPTPSSSIRGVPDSSPHVVGCA